ncbi:hypothetical protein L218DRAFT_975291 [Marasmius fiardii PR-910]|nr:hypothetical protein L218DRAFT_975291 [Marasmius fiardii PR-910]
MSVPSDSVWAALSLRKHLTKTLLSDENTWKALIPKAFQQALINNIFPQLNIDKSLSIRTTCHWLIRLRWRLTQLPKGVYIDGHEREDVVKYHNKVFLPIMVEYERRMAQWELTDDALTHIPPVLRLGEKEIIPQFHDESTFHMNDFRTTAWLAEGQTVLQKKGQGPHHIIYPAANRDAWWDTKQLLEQVKEAITLDALSQHKQKDTIIPQSNPDPQFWGQIQTMTLPDGKGKGLQWECKLVCPTSNTDCCMARLLSKQDDFTHQISMLETLIKELGHECLFLPKFHCELNPIEMYWGWCKHRYREKPKPTFTTAKEVMIKWLDACLAEVIWKFINHSFRFMSTYCSGLTGKAAEWAVQKQQSHRAVLQAAMMNIEAVLHTEPPVQ